VLAKNPLIDSLRKSVDLHVENFVRFCGSMLQFTVKAAVVPLRGSNVNTFLQTEVHFLQIFLEKDIKG